MTLQDLFTEYNTQSIEELCYIFAERIDWYTEMLFDDPWNTWAKVNQQHYQKLLDKLWPMVNNGADFDIDIHRAL